MKKRFLSLVLILAMSLACGLPAAAASSGDELSQVTLKVKQQLDIGDSFTSFSSNSNDLGVTRYWDLHWSDDEGSSIQVTADSSGKIYSYYSYDSTPSSPVSNSSWTYGPAFPKATSEHLEAIAGTFLNRVLPSPESAKLEPVTLRTSGGQTSATVRGTLLLNGVPTELGIAVRIDLNTLKVTSYSRDDYWGVIFTGNIPSAWPAVTQGSAEEKLRSPLALELRYVDDGKDNIVLRYVPVTEGTWYVDAQTGELVDLDQVYQELPMPGGGNIMTTMGASAGASDSSDENGSASLTDVEQATIEQMSNVLSAGELDAAVRGISALGLKGMTLTGSRYTMSRDSGEITCRLTYTRPLTREEAADYISDEEFASLAPTLRKYITLDAASGRLLLVTTSSGFAKDLFQGDKTAVVEDFLAGQYPDYFASTTRTNQEDTNYNRVVNGCPYYSNYLRASVCELDGSIGYFSMSWDDDAQFPVPDGIIGDEQAMEIYANSFETQLYYTAYPQAVDISDPQWAAYAEMMSSVTCRWVLSYVLDGGDISGIDAFTGETVSRSSVSGALTYTDCGNSYAKAQIEALAAHGIGFGKSENFLPAAQLTQRDMLVLLLNATGNGYDVDVMDQETEDRLYSNAYSLGLLTQAQRAPDQIVTRLEFLKALIGASAYGKAAQIQGIYQVSFNDAASIPAADLGYAAIAEGLGVTGGDENHNFAPSRAMTRQDAAIMLYNFMSI